MEICERIGIPIVECTTMLQLDWWEILLCVLSSVLAFTLLMHGIRNKEIFVHALTAMAALILSVYFMLIGLNIPLLESPFMQLQLRNMMARPATAAALMGVSLILFNGELKWYLRKIFPSSF